MTFSLSIVIPTYRRELVLVETIAFLLPLLAPGDELLVIDQTPVHEQETDAALTAWNAAGQIRWLRMADPSIPKAMNRGLLEARHDHVVFFDDDIRPEPELLAAFRSAFAERPETLIAGRVIQPWEEELDFRTLEPNRFASLVAGPRSEFMGGNFGVPKVAALQVGGFDENFVRVAYRFEAEFAYRWRESGRLIWFEPKASIHHLKAGGGGTRTFGDHLTTWRPDHAVGSYYFAFVTGAWREALVRPWRAVSTRFHLRHPWRIPATLWAELRGLAWAIRLFVAGPARIGAAGRQGGARS